MTPPTSMAHITSSSPNMATGDNNMVTSNGNNMAAPSAGNNNMATGATTLHSLEGQNGGNVEFKDGNDNNIHHNVSVSPGTGGHGYANMPPTPTSIVTMLGPNSGKFFNL